jgi:hypothetical protein
MSRYPHVKPRPQKQHKPTTVKSADEALNQDALKLYRLKGGEFIEAAIKRLEKLLALHDREMQEADVESLAKKRWLVSPSMVLRLQRDLERYLKIRADLIEQVFQLMAAGESAQPVPQVTPVTTQDSQAQRPERGQAASAATAVA